MIAQYEKVTVQDALTNIFNRLQALESSDVTMADRQKFRLLIRNEDAVVDPSSAPAWSILHKYPDSTSWSGLKLALFRPLEGAMNDKYPSINTIFANTFLAKNAEVSIGHLAISALLLQLRATSLMPTPETTIANRHVQTALRILSDIYAAELQLGFNASADIDDGDSADPSSSDIANAAALPDFEHLAWDAAALAAADEALRQIVTDVDASTPPWSIAGPLGLGSYMRDYLLPIHLRKVALLSGVDPGTVPFGDTTLQAHFHTATHVAWIDAEPRVRSAAFDCDDVACQQST